VPLDPARLASALTYRSGTRLAVYGSLRPGGRHHDLVDDLVVVGRGTVPGVVGWLDGYPVLTWRPGRRPVPVTVLGGDGLADRWADLDAFEGPAYRRDLVVVDLDGGGRLAAHCYLRAGG
jgi:gamma-glutamylcyclotransferase (GGCT)/AIG2-like uncharacterized protein YtfP